MRMTARGLQVGFGSLVGVATYEELRAKGVDAARIQSRRERGEAARTPVEVAEMHAEVVAGGLRPLTTVWYPDEVLDLPPGADIEVGNEPDLEGPDPDVYATQVQAIYEVAKPLGLAVWAGVVSNLNDRGFDYLRAVVPLLPEGVNISVHRYPHDDWRHLLRGTPAPLVPHKGFSLRVEEVDALRWVIGDRRWGVSEFGYHTAPRTLSGLDNLLKLLAHRYGASEVNELLKQLQWTDEQVKDYVACEWVFWEQQGAEFAMLFQINDGPTDGENVSENHYGARFHDGTWKPVIETFVR
jgi:hypothetical protein